LQQEEIRDLRRFLHSGVARRVGHNRPGDGDKLAYNYKGGRVEESVGHNIRSAQEKLRRIEEDPVPRPPQPLRINPEFDPADLANKIPLSLSQVSVAYGERVLLHDVSLSVGARDRIVLVGPNGVGKTTLLKVMARRLKPHSGTVTTAGSTVIGYLDQEQESLPATGTLYAAYVGEREGEWEDLKVELLSFGLFSWPDLLKPVGSLSVGQKRKLQIAQLMAARANVLLLDEPTNHISLDVLEQFEQALVEFRGAIVAISHDRRFIARVAQQIWELRDGRLIRYLGGWEEYQAAARR
jgi:macrolide transport system ATP-binding/permease protein